MTRVTSWFLIFFLIFLNVDVSTQQRAHVKVNVLYLIWFLYLLFLFNLISICC